MPTRGRLGPGAGGSDEDGGLKRRAGSIFFGMTYILPTQKDAASNLGRFTVRWELLVKGGALMDGYHFPVLKGFEHGPWPDYYISPLTLTQQVVGAAAGAGERVPMRPFEYWIAWAREVA